MVTPAAFAPLRIVFFGTPAFAVPTLERLLDSPHRVCGVVTQPDRPRGRGQQVTPSPVKTLALAHTLPVCQPRRLGEPDVLATLTGWAPDLGVVVAYGRIIPDAVLAIPRLGMINVHGSLLPRYRGAAPVHRAVIDGAPETGITIMRVVTRLDAGPMIATRRRPIGPDETSDAVERDLAVIGAALLEEVVQAMAAGPVADEAQDDRLATYAAKITKEEGLIDWSRPAIDLHNRVRGLHPWPHTYTFLNGARLTIRRAHVEPGHTDREPGTVLHASKGTLHVATGQGGVLAIDEIQAEGRRPLPTRDFLTGHRIAVGARLTS